METCAGPGAAGSAISAAIQFFAASQCLLGEDWPPQAHILNETIVDFIVVGGGTAGATLAARLADLPVSVLLLEAGGDPPLESIIPGFKDTLKGSEFDWNFTTVNDFSSSQALSGGQQRQPRGKMLGGSGSINDMIYARGFPVDYDEWATIVGDDWNWHNVLQYFKKTEHLTDENIINNPALASLHGIGGEIEVSGFKDTSYTNDKFLEAFEELQFKLIKDMTNPNEIGVGQFSHTIRSGKRDSSLISLLNKANGRGNLYVLKHALVTKILIKDDVVYGVKALLDNDEFMFYSKYEVIITAGTFNTAKLLLLSGLGPKKHLQELGIEVVRDLPVGQNLHDHTMVLTYLAANNGTCNTDVRRDYFDTIKYLYDRSGPLSQSSALGAYVSFDSFTSNVPDFAFYPTCIPKKSNFHLACLTVLGFRESVCDRIDMENQEKEILSIAVVNLKPASRGYVRLKSTDPRDAPLIYSGTFSDSKDLLHYPQALEIAWSLVNTSYFSGMNASVVDLGLCECKDLYGDDLLRCIAKTTVMSAWHSVGTAAMGAVVDSSLRVYGVIGLRVADASVMPKIVRGNTNAPVVMIAEKAFDFIEKDYGFYISQK